MKKFRHTRRSVILLLLLSPLTLCIYPIVVFCHVGKEVNRMNAGKEGYRPSMHFLGAFFLGFITIGIVPIVWTCKVAGKIGRAAVEHKVLRPHVSAASFFWLFFFFCWTIVCPIVALCKFFHTLNKTEKAINDEIDLASQEEAQATILPAPEAVEEAPAEAPAAQTPEEVAPAEEAKEPEVVEEKKEDEPLPYEHVTELPPEEIAKDDLRSEIASVYHVADREEIRKWRVRIPGSESGVKIFDTREEALAYAKGLAARKHATVRVKRS